MSPYALIPEGFTLKKVTEAQKKAVSDKRRHDDVLALINNPEIIKQIIITVFAYLAVKEGQEALQDLKDLGANITQDVEDAYTKKRAVKGAPVGISVEEVVEGLLGRIPFL